MNDLKFKVVDFNEWRRGIHPLWHWNKKFTWIPIAANPHGLVEYSGEDFFNRILYFPIACFAGERPVGWTLTYNISDTSVRIRGVYVDPNFRGMGIGVKLCDYAVSRWPYPWFRCVGLWRPNIFSILERKWGLRKMDNFLPRHSYIPSANYIAPYKVICGYKDFRPVSSNISLERVDSSLPPKFSPAISQSINEI